MSLWSHESLRSPVPPCTRVYHQCCPDFKALHSGSTILYPISWSLHCHHLRWCQSYTVFRWFVIHSNRIDIRTTTLLLTCMDSFRRTQTTQARERQNKSKIRVQSPGLLDHTLSPTVDLCSLLRIQGRSHHRILKITLIAICIRIRPHSLLHVHRERCPI